MKIRACVFPAGVLDWQQLKSQSLRKLTTIKAQEFPITWVSCAFLVYGRP